MACPHVAGVVALMLDADPTLTPDEVKQIIRETATRMPGREDYEVGAGYINAFAAVDKVFNRSRAYGAFVAPNFNTDITVTYDTNVEGFAIDFVPQPPSRTSTNTYPFTVDPGLGILDVRVDFGTNAATDEAGNSLGLLLYPPGCAAIECGYNSGLTLPALDSPRRQVVVKNPAAGAWVAEVRGLRGLAAVPAPVTCRCCYTRASRWPYQACHSRNRRAFRHSGTCRRAANQGRALEQNDGHLRRQLLPARRECDTR